MTTLKGYLRADVRAEPLVNRWYAWPQLIPPATAAMHVANGHVPIMQSYLRDPQAHLEATRAGTTLGAPVITFDRLCVDEIRQVLDRTLAEAGPLLELAEALTALAHLLHTEANGGSLEPLYSRVPESLRGYVELVYDLDSHPSMRLIEGLVYASRFYNPSLQEFSLTVANGHYRPSALNTPRLESDGALMLRLPFSDPAVDALFSTTSTPRRLEEIADCVRYDDLSTLGSFFTATRPPVATPYEGPGVRVRYFGHACVLVEWSGSSVLVDPVINCQYGGESQWYSYGDLPATIDYVLVTHGHEDHLHLETLLAIRHRVRTVVVPRNGGGALHDPSLRLLLKNIGFGSVIEVDELDSLDCNGGRIVALPFLGEHGDLSIRTKSAYLIEHAGRKILCVADSNNLEPRLYELLRNVVGKVDVLFVGMECDGSPVTSLYGPLLTSPLPPEQCETRRFRGSDYEGAVDMVRRLDCDRAYVYAMGLEPWLYYLMNLDYSEQSRPIVESNRLVDECVRNGIDAERLYCNKEILLA